MNVIKELIEGITQDVIKIEKEEFYLKSNFTKIDVKLLFATRHMFHGVLP